MTATRCFAVFGRLARQAQLLGLGWLIAACTTPPRIEEAVNPPTPENKTVVPTPAPKPVRTRKEFPPPRAKSPGPIPTRPLNVIAECRFRDETGYTGNMRLTVQEARVQSFEAAVTVPGRGACRFDLKNFRQTRELPNVELNHLRDPCIVRLWEQGERVTVAFQQCRNMCSGTAWDHLWPILNDRRDGSCA